MGGGVHRGTAWGPGRCRRLACPTAWHNLEHLSVFIYRMGSYFLPVGSGAIRGHVAQGPACDKHRVLPLLLPLPFGRVGPWAPPLARTPTAQLPGSDWNEGPDPEERDLRTATLAQPLLPPPPQQGLARGGGPGAGGSWLLRCVAHLPPPEEAAAGVKGIDVYFDNEFSTRLQTNKINSLGCVFNSQLYCGETSLVADG